MCAMASVVLDDKEMLKLGETDYHRKGGRGRERERSIAVASRNPLGRSFRRLLPPLSVMVRWMVVARMTLDDYNSVRRMV